MMRGWRSLLLLSCLWCCVACTRTQRPTVAQYAKEGIAFSHLSDWDVVDQASTKRTTRIVSITGPEYAVIGIAPIVDQESHDVNVLAATIAQGRTKRIDKDVGGYSILLRESAVTLSLPTQRKIAGAPCKGVLQQFGLRVLNQDVPVQAQYFVVPGKHHAFLVFYQVPMKSKAAAKAGADQILDSLQLDDAAS